MTRPARRRGGQGPLPRGVPHVRRVDAAAQRQGRRLRVLQGVHPGAIEPRWTRESVLDAISAWRTQYGQLRRPMTGRVRKRVDVGERSSGDSTKATGPLRAS